MVNVAKITLLSDDPVLGIEPSPWGASVVFAEEANSDGAWLRFKAMELEMLLISRILGILVWKILSGSFWRAFGICLFQVVFIRLT